jgi:pathogenicity locus Cdd1 protein
VHDEGGAVAEREEAVGRLQRIPNVGPKMATALVKLGVRSLKDAAGKDPDRMYQELCAIDAKRYDPCVRDVFAAVVFHADGGPARPWWEFTPQRTARENAEKENR